MKKIIIKELKEIEEIVDYNFRFKIKNDDYISIFSLHTNAELDIVEHKEIEYLKHYGYDIRILKKATLEILEEVADINCADLIRCKKTKRWYLRHYELVKHIEPSLEKEGYYL